MFVQTAKTADLDCIKRWMLIVANPIPRYRKLAFRVGGADFGGSATSLGVGGTDFGGSATSRSRFLLVAIDRR
jgi:hypothetical protein